MGKSDSQLGRQRHVLQLHDWGLSARWQHTLRCLPSRALHRLERQLPPPPIPTYCVPDTALSVSLALSYQWP